MSIRTILCALLGLAILPAFADSLPALSVSAPNAVVMDAESGEVLWSKNMDTPRFPASTTKIMTALLLIEHCRLDDVITAPKGIEDVKESSMHLRSGEKVTARDMLYALLLRSANDGCVAVACHIAGSVPAFAQMMNERAKQLGCTNTHFDNPNGLNDPKHTISAHDLGIIAREAMTHPEFRAVVRQTRHKISRSINQKDLWMVSRNKWLRKDPTADGIKTGWTIPAGHCYVGSATRHGFRVITVVMHSEHWQEDHQKMLAWAFAHFEPDYVNPPGSDYKVPAPTSDGQQLWVAPAHPTYFLHPKGSDIGQKAVAFVPSHELADLNNPEKVDNAVHAGDVVGEIRVTGPDVTYTVPAVAVSDYTPKPAKRLVKAMGITTPTLLIGGVLASGAYAMRRRARRMFRSYLGTS